MNDDTQDQEVGEVIEEQDGSAVVSVDLPEESVSPEDSNSEMSEQNRNRRREKKERFKRINEEKDTQLTLLQRQNRELQERLSAVERRGVQSEVSSMEKKIQEEEERYKWAQDQMKKAMGELDGETFVNAQQVQADAEKKLEYWRWKKQSTVEQAEAPPRPDPRVIDQTNRWMERNKWFNPNGGDTDSDIARVIDAQLARENYDPASSEYWEELDSRLRERLPNKQRRPRSVVTGSERESAPQASGDSFYVSPERVRALKEAGFWDDPKMRAKMIKQYANWNRNNRETA
jgi:hypothetical protein